MQAATFLASQQTRKRCMVPPGVQKSKQYKVIEQRKTTYALIKKKISIEQTRAGLKTIEVQSYCCDVTKHKLSDTIRFYYFTNTKSDFSFCIPGCKSAEKALRISYAVKKYKEKEQSFSALTIHTISPSYNQTVQSKLF